MSRSFKKTPGWADSNPFAKRQANKKVRRYAGDLSDGKGYRKLYDPWDICDWKSLYFGGEHADHDRPYKAVIK